MGFTAIWITPVTGQLPQNTSEGTAYHGYWQQDIYSVNSNYGTADDLKALASALHDRGMYLMLDVVVNHMGYAGAGNAVDYSVFKPFNSQTYFHPFCFISNYDNQTNVEDCWLGDNVVPLPDLNTTKSNVRKIWYDWVGSLVSNYSSKNALSYLHKRSIDQLPIDTVDGLRIDTVKHVQKDFWPGFNDAAGVYCIGEVFDGDTAYTCPYQEVLDGVLNYPLYYPLLKAFQSTTGSMSDLYNMINTVKSQCADSTLLGTFVENHDTPRFASYTHDMALAKNAAAFTILSDGIPIIYAGQEQHYSGGADPANREAVWLSGYSNTSELYKLIARTNAIRNHAISKNPAYVTYKVHCSRCQTLKPKLTQSKNNPIYQDPSTIAMRKGPDGAQVVSVLSNLGASGRSYTLSLSGTGYAAGQQLTEVYSCATVTVDSAGKAPIPMANGLPRVFYPTAMLNGSTICT
ncbi:hypothetical protein CFD26_107243 [Aspergillus turcosus]|uniref:Alpha-amylase n=1 Tax=Aspergillus turcosus TaxID=1245748 RepID=A0A3R7ILD2_9EURO|nr:hypothetical protein CFD26_107243 [Aspergillus turcosus]